MHRFLVPVLLLAALACATFGQQRAPLTLSRCPLAIKITNPLQQTAVFDPVLSRINEINTAFNPNTPLTLTNVVAMLEGFCAVPGVDATGDFWVAILPGAAAPQANEAKGNNAVLLVPLTAPATIRQLLATPEAKAKLPATAVFDRYAVVAMPGTDLSSITGVENDLSLISSRDVVITTIPAAMNPAASTTAGPLAGILSTVMDELRANQQRMEIGLAMQDDLLSLETFCTPVPGSPLATSLQTATPSALPTVLAGYLPDNLASCCAGGAKLNGMPGLANMSLRTMADVVLFVMPGLQRESFQVKLTQLMDQCSQGRALGITTPPVNAPGNTTLVGIYQVSNVNDTAAIVQLFIQEVLRMRDALGGETASNMLKIDHQPAVTTIKGVPVDTLTVTLNQTPPVPAGAPVTPRVPIVLDVRLAYLKDRLLLTAGTGAAQEMDALISRITTNTAGFTAGKHYAAVKEALPADALGFECYSTLDLCRAFINLLPTTDKEKREGLTMLSLFPAQRNPIVGYQQRQGDLVRSELRIPGEQLDFMASLCKIFAMQQQTKAAAAK